MKSARNAARQSPLDKFRADGRGKQCKKCYNKVKTANQKEIHDEDRALKAGKQRRAKNR